MSSNSGVSLAESVVALFLLVAAMLVMTSLLHRSLRLTVEAEQEAVAATVAHNRFAELRSWASQGDNFDALGSLDGTITNSPDYPGFQTQVEVFNHQLYSPCSTFESTLVDPKSLASSAKRVGVKVLWAGGTFRASSLIAEPVREWGNLVITPNGGVTLNVGDSATFTAAAFDSEGDPIADLFYRWTVDPGSGNGMLESQSRDGQSAVFRHQIVLPDGSLGSAAGNCRIVLRAVFRGQERLVRSLPVVLL